MEEVAAMDPPEDGRVASSVDVTSAGTPAGGGAGTGVGRFRVGPGPSSDSPPGPIIDASGNPGRQSARLGVGILSNIPVASVVNDGGAGSGRSWQSQRASVIGDGRTGRSPATSPARTRDAPISGSPLRELRGYAATETARRGSRRGRGTGSAPNTPEVKTGALPDETARWKSSLRAETRGENGRPRDSAMRRQPRADHIADGREAAIDALIAEHEDALRTMKEEMDDERAEMIRSAERIRAEASEGVAEAAAQWLEERKFLNLRVDELETALRAAAEEAEAKRIEADEKFELEKAELRARLESAVEEAAGKEAKMTERFTIEKGVVEEQMESTRQEAAREVAAARDAQAREHERCKAEVERMTARMDEMREAHASELREATEHLEIRLRQSEENAARRLEQQAAAWQRERESMESEAEATRVVLETQLDAAKEDLSAYREHVEGKLVELREESDAHRRKTWEAREVAAEAESIRAEAVASAEAWRKEADLARAFAESARVDAEATLASERAAINEELGAMRVAHEVRVENARRDLEEERARDAEKTANAVAAAEDGVAAALARASASIAREAAAFSTALTLRAWWFHAKYRGSFARDAAVDALVGSRTRAVSRAAVREWFHVAITSVSTSRRATGAVRAYERRLVQSAWIAWARRRAFRAFIDDRAAEHVQRKDQERARQAKLGFMRLWREATRYEDRLRTAHARVATKHRIATLRGYLRAWSGFSKTEAALDVAIERFAERRRDARTRAVFVGWFVTACAERHEDNLAAAATRKFWSFKGRRVLRAWYAVSRELWLDRRVAGSYHVKVRRRTLHRCFHSWRSHRRDEARRRNVNAKAKRHHDVRAKAIAMRAWANETVAARRRWVALARFRKRLERKRMARGLMAWRAASHFAVQLPGMVTEMHRRRVKRRGAQACFFAWRRRARAAAANAIAAVGYRDEYHTARAVRRWRAFTAAKSRAARAAEALFVGRLRESAARSIAALRSNALARGMVANGCRVISARRRRQARSRAFAAWASAVSATSLRLERHDVRRGNRRARYVLKAWFRVMTGSKLSAIAEARRAVAICGFAAVRDKRLTARAFEAWVEHVLTATRHELCVRKMRVVRLAQVSLWGWSARVAAGRAFRTALTNRLQSAASSSRVARPFGAWRVLARCRRGTREMGLRRFAASRYASRLRECLRRWIDATGGASLERRAANHANKVTRWRAKMALKVWREMKRGATYRLDVERAEEKRATHVRERTVARRWSRRWRDAARVKARERVEDVRAWQCACRHLARWGARCFVAWYRGTVVANRRVENYRARVLNRKALGALRAWRLDTRLGEKSKDSRRIRRGEALAAKRLTRRMIACTRAWYAEAASKRRGREVAERMVRRHAHARLRSAWRAWSQLALTVSAYREEAEVGCVAAWKHRGVARVFQAWRARAWNTHSKHPHRIAWMKARLARKRLRHALDSFIAYHRVLRGATSALKTRLVKTALARWFSATKTANDARTHHGVNIWRSERRAWTRARVTVARAIRGWSAEAKRLGYLRRGATRTRRLADVTKRYRAFAWWRYETARRGREENRVRNMEHRVLTMWRRRLDWDNLAAGHADVLSARNERTRRVAWFRAWATEASHGAFVRATRAVLVDRIDPRRLKRWAFYAWHRKLWLKARTGARLHDEESTSWKLLVRSDAGTGTDDSLFAVARLASIPEAHPTAPVLLPTLEDDPPSAPGSPLAPAPTPAATPRTAAPSPPTSPSLPGDEEFAFSPLAPEDTPDNVRQLRRELETARGEAAQARGEAADAREDLAAAEEILREMNAERAELETALEVARRAEAAANDEARAYAAATRTPPGSPGLPGSAASPMRSPSGGGPANIFDLAYGDTFADDDPLTPEPTPGPRGFEMNRTTTTIDRTRDRSVGPPVKEDDEDVSSAFKSWRAREKALMEQLLEARTLAEIAEARVAAAEAEAEAATAAAAHLGWKAPTDGPEGTTASALPPPRDFKAELEACEARLARVEASKEETEKAREETEKAREETLASLRKAEEEAENARKSAEADRAAFAARFGDMNRRALRLETAFNDAERETAEARDKIAELEAKIAELEAKIAEQRRRLKKSGGDVESLTEALLADTAAANERNAALAKELHALRDAKAEVDGKLAASVAKAKELQSRLNESNKLRSELESQLGKLKDRLEKDIEDAAEQDDKIKSLTGDVARVTALLAKSDARKLELEAQLDAVNANIREISGKLDESAAREHDLETKLAAVEPSIARANEELTRVREAHAAAEKETAALRDEKETLDAKLERANSTAEIAWKRCQDLSSRLNGWVRKGVDDNRSGASTPPRVLEELTDALNTARKDASREARRAADAEAKALNMASSEMLLKSRLEDKERIAAEASEAILASAEKASGDISRLSSELAARGGFITPGRVTGIFTQTPPPENPKNRRETDELAEEVETLRAELDAANERLAKLNEDYGEFDVEMDKHDKAELVGQLAEARASLAAALEENRALREEAAAAKTAASRGPGLFPDSPSSGEEEEGDVAADVAAMREAASSLRGAAKVRVALGASLDKTSRSAGFSTGTRGTTTTAFGVPVPPDVAEAVDELVRTNEAMRLENVRLIAERDALKTALGESTRRETVARESLRELKRASLEDAMAMSTRVEAMSARGGAMPMSAVAEQLGELESLVGELARRVPRRRRG